MTWIKKGVRKVVQKKDKVQKGKAKKLIIL